jgi:hypothetical protein
MFPPKAGGCVGDLKARNQYRYGNIAQTMLILSQTPPQDPPSQSNTRKDIIEVGA